MAARPYSWAGAVLVVLIAGAVAPARAQLGVSASVDSDDRPRGVSLSDGQPVAGLNLTYDDAGGVYAGASLTAVVARRSGVNLQGEIIYLGYAGRLGSRASWDVGVSNRVVAIPTVHPYRFDYSEIYAGITRGDFSAHLYYSPSYLGGGAQSLYGEINGAVRPALNWRLFAHVGVLASLGGANIAYAGHTRFDARAGVARTFGKALELRLAVSTTTPGVDFPPDVSQSRTAVIAGASYAF